MTDWRKIRNWPRKAMLKRVARFRDLKGSDGGLPDSRLPECERTLCAVIGFQPPKGRRSKATTSPVGDDASAMPAIAIAEGFNLGYCKARPGKGPLMHNHDSNETFIAMTGRWRCEWNEGKARQHVDLGPLDVISFPVGVARRFMNVTYGEPRREHVLMFIIDGNQPRAEFTPLAMQRCDAWQAAQARSAPAPAPRRSPPAAASRRSARSTRAPDGRRRSAPPRRRAHPAER
jgi:mannose-6-phosphate isomerase-like protein (cupin superfamily)